MSIADLFQWIGLGKKTGTLRLETPDVRKFIYFQLGQVFFASSNKTKERLGQFLVRQGYLSDADLEGSLEIWKEYNGNKKLSEIFVARGFLTQERMIRSLGELVQEIIFDVFFYEHGEFEFQEGYLPPQVKKSFQLDSQWLIMEGLRRLDEYQRNADALPSHEQVLVRCPASPSAFELIGREARLLYDLIDGERDVEMIVEETPFPVYEAQAALVELLEAGLVATRPMGTEELLCRRLRRTLRLGSGFLEQGELARARGALRQAIGLLDGHRQHHRPESPLYRSLAGFKRRLDYTLVTEVERLSGGLERPLTVDPQLLTGQRIENLSADEGFILSRIGEQATLREVLLTSGFAKARAYELLYELLNRGIIYPIGDGTQLAVPT